jgi:hypothetical protein
VGAHLVLKNTNRSGSTRPTSMRQSTLIKTRPVLLLLWIFFRLLWRLPTARQTVASLTLTPDCANRNSALWEWVAHGLSSRSLASSFFAFSSSSGLCRELSSALERLS